MSNVHKRPVVILGACAALAALPVAGIGAADARKKPVCKAKKEKKGCRLKAAAFADRSNPAMEATVGTGKGRIYAEVTKDCPTATGHDTLSLFAATKKKAKVGKSYTLKMSDNGVNSSGRVTFKSAKKAKLTLSGTVESVPDNIPKCPISYSGTLKRIQ